MGSDLDFLSKLGFQIQVSKKGLGFKLGFGFQNTYFYSKYNFKAVLAFQTNKRTQVEIGA